MRTKYLLPCSCGEKIPVDTSQAGGKVQCGSCGNEMSVPSMRGLRTLEVAEVPEQRSAETKRAAWGPRQGLILAGVLLVVLSLLPAGFLYRKMPDELRLDVPAAVSYQHEQIDQMPIDQAWMLWKQDMLGQGLMEYPSHEKQYVEHQRTMFQRWITFALCFAGLGVVMIVAGLAMPKSTRPTE